MNKQLRLIDKSYPVYSEFLMNNDWKLVHHSNKSALFFPVPKNKDQKITLEENLSSSKIVIKKIHSRKSNKS